MSWETKTVMDQREQFVLDATAEDANISELCRQYGISRKTGHKWINRAELGLPLCNQSRRPNRQPSKTADNIEQEIIQLRLQHPSWGGKTIRAALEVAGVEGLPSDKTCCNILKRNGLVDPAESAKHKAYQRFEKEHCNEMWQTDFKGDFLLGNGIRCYPLTILDDHSRFSIRIDPKDTASGVKDSFILAFREYGLPNSVLSDNGAQFAGFRKGYTQFERWLMDLDILPIHGRIKHPQTQGKIERFHRTMKQELLNHTTIMNIEDAENKFCIWRDKYNNIRPHEALGMKRPSDVYEPSQRQYSETIKKYEYGGEHHVIKVNSWGYVRFDKWQVYLSETMIDQYIEFRPSPNGETFVACYRNFKIAEFDTEDGQLIHRSIARL